jgi:7,8-dihydropterin-6-yl-methyl-4-(beta-D-ribofuranosyl)aminobenzene 5'-phosphate synthase
MSVKNLKITTLADNLVLKAGLHGQWGLSFLLDIEDINGIPRRIIFDTANDKAPFLYNIKKLETDLGKVDAVVISHGHGDHTVATVEIVKAAGGCPVYAHPHTFLPRFYISKEGKRREGGVPEGQGITEIEAAGGEVILSEEPVEVVPGLWTTGQIPRMTEFEKISPPTDGGRRVIVIEGEEHDDQILCDQAIWTEVEGVGPWIITGCAHSGPINTILHAESLGGFDEINGLIGGTHLVGRDMDYIGKTIESLREHKIKFLSPCHCTGFKAMAMLWSSFTNSFVLNYCGREFKVGEEVRDTVI